MTKHLESILAAKHIDPRVCTPTAIEKSIRKGRIG